MAIDRIRVGQVIRRSAIHIRHNPGVRPCFPHTHTHAPMWAHALPNRACRTLYRGDHDKKFTRLEYASRLVLPNKADVVYLLGQAIGKAGDARTRVGSCGGWRWQLVDCHACTLERLKKDALGILEKWCFGPRKAENDYLRAIQRCR